MGETGYTVGGPFSADIESLLAPAGEWNVEAPNLTDYLRNEDPTGSGGEKVMDIVNILRGNSNDGEGGLGVNFDPSRAATNLSAAEELAGFTPGVEGRVTDSLQQSVIDTLKGNAAKMSLVSQLGGQVNPGDLLNPQGLLTAPARAMMSAAGVETPKGFWGGLTENLPVGLAAFAGLNPVVGTAAGLLGPVMADTLGDYFGLRENDDLRDQLEEVSGQLRGRRQYQTLKDRMNEYGVTPDQGVLESEGVNTWGDAANVAQERLDTWSGRSQPNMDEVLNQTIQRNAYQMAQNLIDYGKDVNDVMDVIGKDYGSGGRGSIESIDRDLDNFFRDIDRGNSRRSKKSRRSGGDGGGNGFGGSGRSGGFGDRTSSPGGMGGV